MGWFRALKWKDIPIGGQNLKESSSEIQGTSKLKINPEKVSWFYVIVNKRNTHNIAWYSFSNNKGRKTSDIADYHVWFK